MLQINKKLSFLYTTPKRFKSVRGGRGGGKSHDFATACLMRGYESPIIIACLREYQKNLSESVHRLLSQKIREDEILKSFYTIYQDKIIGANGTEFSFSGIKNAVNFKSFEGADIAWVEEAQTISQDSLDILIPTIRKHGSEIWFSWNPNEEKDPIYQFCVVNPRDNMISVNINYDENPNCTDELLEEAEYTRTHDYDKYRHVWLGYPRKMSNAAVFKNKFIVKEFDLVDNNGILFYNDKRVTFKHGLDFGFSVDPTAATQSFIQDGVLYITKEVYRYHLETDDIIPAIKSVMPESLRCKWYADNARPETIAQLAKVRTHRDGHLLEALTIEAAIKGKGSVVDGIEYLKNFKQIVIHPRCKNAIYEFENYQYKQDLKTGEIFAELEDKNNHFIDALRYSYNEEIQALRIRPMSVNPAIRNSRLLQGTQYGKIR